MREAVAKVFQGPTPDPTSRSIWIARAAALGAEQAARYQVEGEVSGNLSVSGRTYPVRGPFNGDGSATHTIRLEKSFLSVKLTTVENGRVSAIDIAVTGGEVNYSALAFLAPPAAVRRTPR